MVSIKKQTRVISIILMSLILCQSCRVYKKENVTLKVATEEGKRVKLTTNDGTTLKFKKIVLDDNQYYGVKKTKGKEVLVPIKTNDTKLVRLHNKTMSIIYGTGIGLVVIGVVTIIIAAISYRGPDIPVDIDFN
ncbi:hypothetical protein [Winogradskyella helgolandensis]|uniref:hypothetical protein n=1 Tax=Winogradskyella helgolandensis TaxID=2697010 RepID=UPI0015B93B78|nr:hypothetical protein [Winogradskyella helgolandensis]